MEKKTINRFAISLLMSAGLPFARGSFLSRITKLWFLLCFFMPSMVLSYDFPPERSLSVAETEIGWLVALCLLLLKVLDLGFLLQPQFQMFIKVVTS